MAGETKRVDCRIDASAPARTQLVTGLFMSRSRPWRAVRRIVSGPRANPAGTGRVFPVGRACRRNAPPGIDKVPAALRSGTVPDVGEGHARIDNTCGRGHPWMHRRGHRCETVPIAGIVRKHVATQRCTAPCHRRCTQYLNHSVLAVRGVAVRPQRALTDGFGEHRRAVTRNQVDRLWNQRTGARAGPLLHPGIGSRPSPPGT